METSGADIKPVPMKRCSWVCIAGCKVGHYQQKDPMLIYGYKKITVRQEVPNWSSTNRSFVSRVASQEAK